MNRVLIIDDDPSSALALRVMLDDRGYEVSVELNSPKAVDAVREFKPDAVLIDFMMPKVHGGDVAWQLTADPALHGIKVILYSNISAAELRPKLPPRDIPILEKPVSVDALLRLLAP